MRRILLVVAVVALCAGRASAAEERLSGELMREGLIEFGMEFADLADVVADQDDWDLAYEISTPSTYDCACRYKEALYFQARFYLGRCYYVEKRLEVEPEETEPLFEHFRDKFGKTQEASQSHDGRLAFARWVTDDREVSLTAYRRESGSYVVTYEEFNPEVIGLARQVQERELDELPVEQDPLTGKDRPAQPK